MKQLFYTLAGGFIFKNLFKEVVKSASGLIDYSFESFKLQNFDILNGELRIVLAIVNKTDVEIPYEGIAARIYHGGRELGILNDKTPTALAPLDTTRLALVFRAENDELLLRLADILTDGGALQPFVFDGIIKLKGQNLPIKRDIPLLK